MRELVTCLSCHRHVDLRADECPFCGHALEPTRVESPRGRLSRAALFGVAMIAPACGSSAEPVERPAYVEPADQGGEVVQSDPPPGPPDAGPALPPDPQPPPPNMPYGAPPMRTRLV
jgi:hypothetical protein